MQIFESIISGIVQGITEFLPVSSSGHLVILHSLFSYEEPKILEGLVLHFGTLLAVVIFFWKDLLGLFKDKKRLASVILGTIPIVISGFLFSDKIEALFVDTKAVGIALLVTGAWLFCGDLACKRAEHGRQNTNVTAWQALLIGVSQAIALIPGISRSGATISTGLLLKRNQETAFRFSFLLSVPAVLGAVIYKLKDIARSEITEVRIMMWGGLTACIVGVFSLWFLKKMLSTNRFYFFSIYCWIVGTLMLAR